MFDIVIRYCGRNEWLPLIKVVGTRVDSAFKDGDELFRGERLRSHEAAWNYAVGSWESGRTQHIIEFKKELGIE